MKSNIIDLKTNKTTSYNVVQITKPYHLAGLYTREAYEDMRMNMSTGDYSVHNFKYVNVDSLDNVLTMDDIIEQSWSDYAE